MIKDINRGISRRTVLAGGAAAGTMIAAPMGLSSAQAAPKRGGNMRYGCGHGSTTDSMDPATYENNFTGVIATTIFNQLIDVDDQNKSRGALAESWEASDDATSWRFNLRKGVTFHNGGAFTSKDVVASFRHHMHEDSKSGAKGILTDITDIKADGDHVVVFTLKNGNAGFPFIVSDYHLCIVQAKDDGSINWQDAVGTGPYMLTSFEPGVRATFKRNPNYFRSDAAWFDSGEIITIADAAARTNALTSGDVDLIDRLDLKTVHLLKRNKNVVIEETTGTRHYTFAMDTRAKPFDDNNVRQALKYSIDREQILKKVLRGHGAIANDSPISPANPYYNPDVEQHVYDPDKAKWYLQQSGLSSLKVDLSAADAAFAGSVDAAVLYKAQAKAADIEINVIREPNDGYWSNVWMKKPWCAVYWNGRPTEDWMFSTAYADGAPWNDSFWKHERFNKLLVEARAELNEAKRRTMYGEMQQIVSHEGGVVIPMFANYVFARTKNVQHSGSLSSRTDLDSNRFMERWWFA